MDITQKIIDSNVFRKQIGKTILDRRTVLDLSYYRLQKETDLTLQQIKSIEKGEKNYTVISLLILCDALDIKIELKNK